MILESGVWEAPDCERELDNQTQTAGSRAYDAVFDIRQRQYHIALSKPGSPVHTEKLGEIETEANGLFKFAGLLAELWEPKAIASFDFHPLGITEAPEKFGQPPRHYKGLGVAMKLGLIMPGSRLEIEAKDCVIDRDYTRHYLPSDIQVDVFHALHVATKVHSTNHRTWRETVLGEPSSKKTGVDRLNLLSRRAAVKILDTACELSPVTDYTQVVLGVNSIRDALVTLGEQPSEPPLDKGPLPVAASHLTYLANL